MSGALVGRPSPSGTLRVLRAIEREPLASSRRVAQAAGIVDESDVSELLARLASAGAIASRGQGVTRGLANAWRLTPRGESLLREARRSVYREPPRG